MSPLTGFPLKKKAVFFRQLATLIDAATPVSKALVTAGRQSIPGPAAEMGTRIDSGVPLSKAMADYPRLFSQYEVNLVSAGEVSGNLDGQLENLASSTERSSKLQTEVVSKLIYPIVVLHFAVFVPPLFLLVTKGLGAYLRMTLGIAIPVYLVVLLTWALYRIGGQGRGFRRFLDSVLALTPVLGGSVRTLATSRFLSAMSYLSESGFNPGRSVEISAESCGNSLVSGKILAANSSLGDGARLSQLLAATRLFPPLLVSMVASGEEAGQASRMLAKAADHLDTELQVQTHRLMTIVPIVMLLGVGAVVGFVAYRTMAAYIHMIPGL